MMTIFFSKSESERYDFLLDTILQKIDLLEEVIKKKKLDTDIKLLKSDIKNVHKNIMKTAIRLLEWGSFRLYAPQSLRL